MANIADNIKTGLRRIAHTISHADCEIAVRDFMASEFFKGKLKNWFTKTWLVHIKRWCLTYRLDDLILCNTNNGTERLNEDLKYDNLDGYKNCSLSELLTVLVNSFVPKHYKRYIELNVKYGDGYKKYASGIPEYLRNRPKQIVDILLEKLYRATPDMKVTNVGHNVSHHVESSEEGTAKLTCYNIFLGNETKFCSCCNCHDFRRYRMLCKHFFAVFNSGEAMFSDLSSLFLKHPFMVLDNNLFGENCINDQVSSDYIYANRDTNNTSKEQEPKLKIDCKYDELPVKTSLLQEQKIK